MVVYMHVMQMNANQVVFFGYCNIISSNTNHCYHTKPILQVEVEQKTTEWTALWVYRAEDLLKITAEYRNMLTIDCVIY